MAQKILFLIGVCGVCLVSHAQNAWLVPDATVCAEVSIGPRPQHPDLGIFVKIPDGGLLPGPIPVPEVRDANGKVLESIIVGYHQTDGLGVLFAVPESDTASVYVRGMSKAPAKPQTKLTPSVVYLVRNTRRASLENAKRMATEYPPAQGAFFDRWGCIGCMVNPFGPDNNYSAWYVGCILLDKPEKIYFATVSGSGSEFAIDGKTIFSWAGGKRDSSAKGQRGAEVQLSAGLHRIDYFHSVLEGSMEAQLVWRRAGVTDGPLPEMVTGFAKSGEASIKRIRLKDGRVCGVIERNNTPTGYFWTGEKPLNLFDLSFSGVNVSDAANVSVTWEIDNGKILNTQGLEWLAPGLPDAVAMPVTLAVSNAAGIARTSARLSCPWTPTAFSLDNQDHRLRFRKALNNMVRAVPPPADPCASWNNDMWEMLVELVEPYKAGPILLEIFNRGYATLQKRPQEQRWVLEDRFIETVRVMRKDDLLLEWIGKFEKNERNNARRFRWRDERVCAYLYDLAKPGEAERELKGLKETSVAPDQAQIVAIRLGDLARMRGNTDEALKFYKEAQEKYRARNKIGMAGGRMSFVGERKVREAEEAAKLAAKNQRQRPSLKSQMKVDDWKIYTVHDASMYSTIMSFLSQNAIPEAFQKLNDWENESPVSKLSGELPMAEAKVYLAVNDLRRAVASLEAYRKNVTMSAQLADAMRLEVECLEKMRARGRMKEVAEDFVKRFPGHPYEKEMKEVVAL